MKCLYAYELITTGERLHVNENLKIVHHKAKAEDSYSMGIIDKDPPLLCISKHSCAHLNFCLCPLALSLAINTL